MHKIPIYAIGAELAMLLAWVLDLSGIRPMPSGAPMWELVLVAGFGAPLLLRVYELSNQRRPAAALVLLVAGGLALRWVVSIGQGVSL